MSFGLLINLATQSTLPTGQSLMDWLNCKAHFTSAQLPLSFVVIIVIITMWQNNSFTSRLYARQQNASCIFAIAWASVRLTVHLSVTLLYCIKTMHAKITVFTVRCPKNLSLSWRNFVPLGERVPLEWRHKKEYPIKNVILPLLALLVWKRLWIGTYMLLIITSTGDGLFRFINIDNFERHWTPQRDF